MRKKELEAELFMLKQSVRKVMDARDEALVRALTAERKVEHMRDDLTFLLDLMDREADALRSAAYTMHDTINDVKQQHGVSLPPASL